MNLRTLAFKKSVRKKTNNCLEIQSKNISNSLKNNTNGQGKMKNVKPCQTNVNNNFH